MRNYFEYEFNDQIKERMLEYYDRSSGGLSDFDDGKTKIKLKLDRIKKYISYNIKDSICDVGCADGSLLAYLSGYYHDAVGYDISEKAINRCKTLGLKNVTFQTYDGKAVKTDQKFDKIFIMDVLEHSFEPEQLTKSLYDNLKFGGMLIIQVPSTGWLSEIVFGKYHYGHLRYYDAGYLKEYLEKTGFRVRHIETFNSVPGSVFLLHRPRLFSLLNAMCSMIPHRIYPYYGSIAAVAEKPV